MRLEGAVDDPLGDGLLAVEHDGVHEFGEHDVPELRIGEDFALLGAAAAGHGFLLFSLTFRLFRTLGAVFGAALAAVLDTLGVEHAAQHVVADAGQVADAAAADQHHQCS